MNRGPRAPGAPEYWGQRKILGNTLRKISKIVATRWRILRLKCTKFDFGWGSAQTPLGELTALPRPPSWIWGPLRGRGRGWAGEEEKGGGREGKWRGGKGGPPSYCWTRAPQSLATPLPVYSVSSILQFSSLALRFDHCVSAADGSWGRQEIIASDISAVCAYQTACRNRRVRAWWREVQRRRRRRCRHPAKAARSFVRAILPHSATPRPRFSVSCCSAELCNIRRQGKLSPCSRHLPAKRLTR